MTLEIWRAPKSRKRPLDETLTPFEQVVWYLLANSEERNANEARPRRFVYEKLVALGAFAQEKLDAMEREK